METPERLTTPLGRTTAKFGNALVFDGSTSWITIPDSPSLHLTTGMTLEAWVNPSTITNNWRDVIYKFNDAYYLEATSDRGGVPGRRRYIRHGRFSSWRAPLVANTWSHLAVTYDGATLILYVNGVQVASLSQSGNIGASTSPLQIGGDTVYSQFFAGTIDEVRVYNQRSESTSDPGGYGHACGRRWPVALGQPESFKSQLRQRADGKYQQLAVRDLDECWRSQHDA